MTRRDHSRDIDICNAVRTPVGRMGGVLAPLTAAALAMQVVQVLASAAYDVGRRKARFVLVTTCIAGGQGLAAIFEAVR